MKKASTNGQKLSYADSHSVVRLSSKRFEQSPYSDKYVNEKTVFGLYSNRFYPLTLGGDAIDDYWRLRQGVVLYDVPEKPLEISGPDAVTLLERVLTRPERLACSLCHCLFAAGRHTDGWCGHTVSGRSILVCDRQW